MKNRIIERLARLSHSAWRDTKKASGHNGHEVNGHPYNLDHHWHELPAHFQDFDRAIARRMLERMLSVRFWFG